MLKIRLQRVGRTNVNTFRVVITDSKNSAKSGKSLEVLGFHDPVNNKTEVKVDRIKHWISNGAQLSENLHNLFINKKIITGKKINVLPLKSKTVSRKEAKANKAAAKSATPTTPATPKTEAPKA
jgi:small subunit ribosomal protein S16